MSQLTERKKRVWLVTVGEPLPTDPGHPRLLRVGMLAELLVAAGHDVVWWTSNFDHYRKVRRHPGQTSVKLAPNYEIVLLEGIPYQRNISLQRFINHRQLGGRFRQAIEGRPLPDVIHASYPIVELCQVCTDLGNRHGIPVVLDMRDCWPDIFTEVLPAWAQPLGSLLLTPLHREADRVSRATDAITGITQAFVDWGLARAGRAAGPQDQPFSLFYRVPDLPDTTLAEARNYWAGMGVDGSIPTICFFGSLGSQFRLETVLTASRLLERQGRDVKFVICGEGDSLPGFRAAALGHTGLVLPGWVDSSRIQALMGIATLGLAPYVDTLPFRMSVPNKVIEYMSAGLPIITCLRGEVEQLNVSEDFGYQYDGDSPEDLVRAVSEALDNPQARAAKAGRAKALFTARFDARIGYQLMADYLLGLRKRSA